MTHHYNITQISEFTYKLKINGDYATVLYKSIKKAIKSVYHDIDTQSIFFSAESVVPLKQYLLEHKEAINAYKISLRLISHLTQQLMCLKKWDYGFYGFDIDDILIIDNTFVFCSTEHLLPLIEDKLVFYAPIKKPTFVNPEILELTTLPAEVSHQCSYYSLGMLTVFLLVGNKVETAELEYAIQPFKHTKIYWFIKRCLDKNADNRILLLI